MGAENQDNMDDNNSTNLFELNKEIDTIIEKFSDISRSLRGKDQASYLNHSKIQWTGGILGAIAEYKQDKRLEKLLNAPIYGDLSFYKMTWFIIDETEKLVDKQLEIQKLSTPEDEVYYGNVKRIFDSLTELIQAWYNYSPEAAEASLTLGDQKDVGLYLTVDYQTKNLLKKLDLPPQLKLAEDPPVANNSSGCLGVFVSIIVIMTIFFL